MCNIDYEYPTIYSEKTPKAKKTHECCECKRQIQTGEKYRYVFGVWDKIADSFRICSHCLKVQEYIRDKCGGFIFTQLEEELLEHLDSMKVARFLVGMRRQWRKFKSNELMNIKEQ